MNAPGPQDQAHGLRALLQRRVLRLLPVLPAGDPAAQGTAAALLARELAVSGRNVILLDETGACASVLGVKPRHDLLALIEGAEEFNAVALRAGAGLRYVAAAAGLPALIGAGAAGEAFFAGFLNLAEPADMVVLNLAGTLDSAGAVWLPAFAGAGAALLVAGMGERDVTGAYAAIKQAHTGAVHAPLFRVMVNGAAGEREARVLAATIGDAAHRFLGAGVAYAGNVSPTVSGAPLGRALPSQRHPEAVQAFARLVRELGAWPLAECAIDDSDPSHPN
jgi:MinD-like ATPase involved in chromosome partitioning or flagellar assembly